MASYYKSGPLFLGALLFSLSQLLHFIQLFRDAAARKAANQAPPENFTASGIIWFVIVIVVLLGVCFLLWRYRKGALHMARGRLFLLLSILLALWGLYYVITFAVEMVRNSEFTLLFDVAGAAVAVIAPIVLLQLADITEELPDDMLLLIFGAGGTLLSVVSLVILMILREGYAAAQLLLTAELMFRAAMALFGVAALQKAFKLRASYPVVTEADGPAPSRHHARMDEPVRRRQDDAPVRRTENRQRPSRREEDDFGLTARMRAPKQVLQEERRSLRSFVETDFDEEIVEPPVRRHPERTAYVQPTWDTGRIIVQGGTGRIPTQDPGRVPSERQTCPYCGKRMPVGFPTCPRCGKGM